MSAKKPTSYEMEIPSVPSQIRKVERLTEKVANKIGFSQDEKDSLAIAVTEAVNNAIHHGNKNDPNKKVFVKLEAQENKLVVHVKDQGEGFNPDKVSDPLKPENLLKESGRGIFILRTLMDDVKFSFSKQGTEIILIKVKEEK